MAAARRKLLSDGLELDAAELREAWLDLTESWLTAKAAEIGITDTSGFAIVGIGGLGRRKLLPYSDLDLMLLHDNVSADVLERVADRLCIRCGTPMFALTTACEPCPGRSASATPIWWLPWACWKHATSPATRGFRRS